MDELFFETSSVEHIDVRAKSLLENRVRVLHVLTNFKPGESQRQCLDLLGQLDENRFELRLAALHRGGPLLEKVLPRFPDIPEFPITGLLNTGTLHQVKRLGRLLKLERIAILHAHDFESGVLSVLATRISGTPVIVSQPRKEATGLPYQRFGQKIIQRYAKKILVNSESVHKQLTLEQSSSRRKFVLIRNGLNIAGNIQHLRQKQRALLLEELALRDEALVLGTVAQLESAENHAFLLEAMARVVAADSNHHFVLVGDGPLREQIVSQIELLGIKDQVHLLGDREDSSQLVAGFDLAIFPSEKEDLPISLLEAMAMGVPVVAIAAGGALEVVKNFDTGFLVQPGNTALLADRISYVISRRDEAVMIGMRGRRYVLDQFSLQRMVESVEMLYDEVLQA